MAMTDYNNSRRTCPAGGCTGGVTSRAAGRKAGGWNGFVSFVHKEFMHIFRDVRSMMVLLGSPVVLLLLFGYAVSTEVGSVRVAVLDNSHDVLTSKICSRLASNAYTGIVGVPASAGSAGEMLRRGDADVVVVFGNDFADRILHEGRAEAQVLVDGTEPNQATMRLQYVSQVIASMRSEVAGCGIDDAGAAVVPVTRLLYNPQQKSEYNFVPGVIGMILMLVCVMMSSISIVREKETGTMEVLLVSPISPSCIIMAKLVPYFVISMLNVAMVLLLSRFVLGVPMAGSLLCFLGVTLLYVLVALTLGLFISNLVRTQLAAMVLSLLFIIPTVYLSGLAFPLESMPEVLQYVSAIVPARWYIDAARRLMIQGVEARFILQDVWVMCVMEAVLLVVSLRKFKLRI